VDLEIVAAVRSLMLTCHGEGYQVPRDKMATLQT